jgi:hypothetical protein
MRALLIAAAIATCAIVSGCGQNQPQQTAQAAAPTCACRPTAPEETAAAARTAQSATPVVHRHRRWRVARREHRRWRSAYSRTDFTQSVLAPYDYVSESRVVSYESRDARYDRGYGRRIYSRRWRGGETVAATMTGERLDPWYGYDVHCNY